jgi:hypothetical protein
LLEPIEGRGCRGQRDLLLENQPDHGRETRVSPPQRWNPVAFPQSAVPGFRGGEAVGGDTERGFVEHGHDSDPRRARVGIDGEGLL